MKKGLVLVSALFLSSFAVVAQGHSEHTTDNELVTTDREGRETVTPKARALGFRDIHELNAYFGISEVTVTEDEEILSPVELAITGIEIQNGTANDPAPENGGSLTDAIQDLVTGGDLGDIKKWVTLGSKIWELIKNNQPVLNVKTQTTSVLPAALSDWRKMETWQGPQAKSYTIAAKNLYGVTVISHRYTVAFHYGGSYQGHGRFLANATIIPSNVSVSWGFTLNSKVQVGEPLNTGTVRDPVPSVDLGLDWSMSSVLKKMQGLDQFNVRGDGTTAHVNLF